MVCFLTLIFFFTFVVFYLDSGLGMEKKCKKQSCGCSSEMEHLPVFKFEHCKQTNKHQYQSNSNKTQINNFLYKRTPALLNSDPSWEAHFPGQFVPSPT